MYYYTPCRYYDPIVYVIRKFYEDDVFNDLKSLLRDVPLPYNNRKRYVSINGLRKGFLPVQQRKHCNMEKRRGRIIIE